MNTSEFKEQLLEWTTNYTEGRIAKATNKIGLLSDNKTILYTEIKGKADTSRREPRQAKYPKFEKWENFVLEMREKAPNEGMRNFKQASGTWQ